MTARCLHCAITELIKAQGAVDEHTVGSLIEVVADIINSVPRDERIDACKFAHGLLGRLTGGTVQFGQETPPRRELSTVSDQALPIAREGQSTPSLFVDDRELHRRTAPHIGWDTFRAIIRALEDREGFPAIHKLWRGRYWPACEAWLDSHYGAPSNGGRITDVEDGAENFDAPARQTARVQDRPNAQGRNAAPVLDRAPGRARSARIPRLVHPAAAERG